MRRLLVAACVVCTSCAFDLDAVQAPPPVGSDASSETDGPADGWVEVGSPEDAGTEDAPYEAEPIDGCWPPSEAELCAATHTECGPLETTDACGQVRSVTCADCSADAHCEQGACIAYAYSWVTGEWSSCSVNCDGGTKTRDVYCERDDGLAVADSSCQGSKPATTDTCHEHPCCVTPAAMDSERKCSGGTSDIVNWVQFHFGLDDGSPANQAECAAQCTAWAQTASLATWCCDLVEDTTTGHSYSCAAHTGTSTTSFSHPDSDGGYASIGSCDTP